MAITTVANTAAMGGTTIIVPAGATAAVLITPEAGEIGSCINTVSASGGSLMIFATPWAWYHCDAGSNPFGFSLNSTWAAASLIALGSSFNAYPLPYGTAVNVSGAAKYYIMSVGATSLLGKNIQLSQGNA